MINNLTIITIYFIHFRFFSYSIYTLKEVGIKLHFWGVFLYHHYKILILETKFNKTVKYKNIDNLIYKYTTVYQKKIC